MCSGCCGGREWERKRRTSLAQPAWRSAEGRWLTGRSVRCAGPMEGARPHSRSASWNHGEFCDPEDSRYETDMRDWHQLAISHSLRHNMNAGLFVQGLCAYCGLSTIEF